MLLIFRNKRKLIFLSLIIILGSFLFSKSVNAHSKAFGSVPVTYTMNESLTYPLNVYVTGEGEVLSGSDILRNQKKQYLLEINEAITFELKASEKSKLKSVKLDGEDVTNKLKGNRITIEGTSNEQILSVIFDEKKSGVMFPNTGDLKRIGLYIVLFIISLGIVIYMYYRDKKLSK
ncbi:sortase B protein-sorting domain-containing protein (plasmid) [Clostridium baratii]